ncbi:unnamed protein product [Arctogadus glacialis]
MLLAHLRSQTQTSDAVRVEHQRLHLHRLHRHNRRTAPVAHNSPQSLKQSRGRAPPSPLLFETQRAPRQVTMVSQGLQLMGVLLAFVGWVGTIATCAMPMWRVTAFVGANIVTAQTIWEGLWMTCVVQSTGQMQCKIYDSMLALSSDLQAARAMVIVSVVVGVFGALTAIMGGKCTNCMEDPTAKAKACVVSGVIFLISAFLVLIPVSWSAHTIIRDFYNPLVNAAQRRELGASLYLGWGSAGLLLLGGGLLCNNCPPKENRPYTAAKFAPPRSASANRDYV